MNATSLKSWLGQVTTGGGVATLLGVLSALATHTVTLADALPVIIGAVVAIIMPENKSAATAAQTVTTDLVAAAPTLALDVTHLIKAYQLGAATVAPVAVAPAPVAVAAPVAPVASPAPATP